MAATGVKEVDMFYENLKAQALDKNDKSVITWSKYKDDLEVTKSLVDMICKKIKHNVMVPIGTKALMRGKIVHTNEYLVNLGETWFAKRSAHQTIELCDRRIKNCNEMLEKLKKERELIVNKSTLPAEQEAFGSEERPEIIEYVSEQENEEWKKQHRLKEKKYRQELAELRKAEKTPIQTEEDLWKHLDELELQEELEDELNRLNADCSSEEDTNENFKSEFQQNENLEAAKEEENSEKEELKSVQKEKRRVSFACDFDSSDDEPLLLEIKHSEVEPVPYNPDCKQINSPVDIYHHHLNLINKMPLSVLKNKTYPGEKNNLKSFQYNDEDYDDDVDDEGDDDNDNDYEPNTTSGVYLKDVTERCVSNEPTITNSNTKKISKFKSSRKKNS